MQWIKKKSQLVEYYPFSRTPGIPEDFAKHLKKPNKKHLSVEEKWKLVGWLNDPNAKPSCQRDYSRRNYAQKTYRWDENRQKLMALAKNGREHDRIVVTVDEILQAVEEVHITDHGGWDATWDRVRQKYCGVIRADVIWLVTRCGMCKSDPRKKSKGNHENRDPAAPAPVPSPPMTPPELQVGYYGDDTTQIAIHQDTYQDIYHDTYQDIHLDGYLDIFQDGYQDVFQNSYEDVYQGGFQDALQGEYYQDGGWQDELMSIDPSLLALEESPYANYSQGESSGTNNYTYHDGFGQ
ncbi:hypothetical protein V8C42DRAFT_327450 [Trichoderma barbatum]